MNKEKHQTLEIVLCSTLCKMELESRYKHHWDAMHRMAKQMIVLEQNHKKWGSNLFAIQLEKRMQMQWEQMTQELHQLENNIRFLS